MKAAVYTEKGVLEIKDVPKPQVHPGQLLVRVTYCGICGTDLHNYSYGIPSQGAILGHEWCGIVEAIGDCVEEFSVGDRVMYYKHAGFDVAGSEVRTRNLRPNPRAIYSAPGRMGAFAEYFAVNTSQAERIPDNVSDKAAASLEPLVAGVHAVRLGKLKPSDTVAFIGTGPIALYMIERVKQIGVKAVYAAEICPVRAAKAKELGVEKVFDPEKEDFISEIVERTGGRGPDVVYECAAGGHTLNQACTLVANNGRIVCLAVYQGPVTIEPLDWYMRQPEIKFTTNGDSLPADWETSLKLIQTRAIDVEEIISHVITLEEIQDTFLSLLDPRRNTMLRVLAQP